MVLVYNHVKHSTSISLESFAATMRELSHLESITLDHKWWSWHWRPTKLIDLLCDHNWPNLRSCILKFPFATCSQIKAYLQPHVRRLGYLRIEGFPRNDRINRFSTRGYSTYGWSPNCWPQFGNSWTYLEDESAGLGHQFNDPDNRRT